MPRQFSYRGDRLAYSWGIVLLSAVAAFLIWLFHGERHRPDPALLRRRVRVLHPEPDRDGQALARGARERLAVAARDQCLRGAPDGCRPRRRRQREVRRRRLPRRDPHPDPGRHDAVHPPPVRRVAARAGGPPGPGLRDAPSRGARRAPDPRREPGRHPGGERGPLRGRRRPGGVHHREPGGRRRRPRALGAPDPGRAAGRGRVAVPGPGRTARGLPRRPRCRLAAGQAGPDHVRRPARVRRPQGGGSGCSTTSR